MPSAESRRACSPARRRARGALSAADATARRAGAERPGGVGSTRSTPPLTTARAPSPRSSAPSPSARISPQATGRAGAQPVDRVLREAPHDEPRERRRQRAEVRDRDVVAAGERRVDDLVEHRRLVAQQLAPCARRCARPPGAARAARARARRGRGCGRRRGSSLEASSRQRRPRARAVRSGLLARDPQQRAHEQPVALGHPEQRAPPGRRGQPVEDRLGLVARGVAGRQPRAARERQPRAGAEPHVARPGLQVAGVARARGGLDLERDAEPLAQRAAERLVGAGGVAQAVVDVQRAARPAAPASRTATSSRQTESRPPDSSTTTGAAARQQTGRADAIEQVHGGRV